MINATTFERAADDDAFGPFVEPLAHDRFDFTLLFEQSVFSIGPSAVILLVAPLRLLYLSRSRRVVVRASLIVDVKLISFTLLSMLQCASLALWARVSELRTRASVAAAALSLASTLALSCLSFMEHGRSIKPSLIINAYLLLTLPLDFAQVRTLWLRGGDVAVAACFSAATALKLGLLVIEAIEKGRILLPPYRSTAPEATSGLYSRSVFWWLNPLFLLGHGRVLSNDTLLDIDDTLATESVYARFQKIWSRYAHSGRKYALVRALGVAMLLPLAAPVAPRLIVIFFRFMQPLLIRNVSTWVSLPVTELTTKEGWGLTAAFGLVYGGLAITSAIYYHQVYRSITMIRGALVATIYSKTLELSTSAFQESAAVTLMSTDVQKICDALSQMHEVWASMIEIAIATWLLSQQIGFALLGPLLITVASVAATMAVSNQMGPAQGAWMAAIQTRIDATAKILESMKEVKMLGMTPVVSTLLRTLRGQEITKSLKSRRLLAICITLGNVSSALGPGMAFIIYVTVTRGPNVPLDVPRAFTTLSLVWLLANPVASLIFSFPPLLEALACAQRIQRYLLLDDRVDHRLLAEASVDGTSSSIARTVMAPTDVELQPMRSESNTQPSDQPVVRLIGASFAWQQEGLPVVKDVSLEFPHRSLTFIVGPVGCGKTTLLKGMLGEIETRTGTVHVQMAQAAFAGQGPWIQNETLRNNILGASVYVPEWYDTVVHACALVHDIASLAQGDLTVVGSAGSSLSGGQKLRVALARAVYAHCQLLLLDDCFSGIDAKTEDMIFTRLFGQQGLLRRLNTTVVLSTHAAHRLSYSDRIIVLSADGAVLEEGSYSALMERNGYVSSLIAVRHRSEAEQGLNPDDTASPASNTGPTRSMVAPPTLQPARIMGDRQVYKYYFGAAGWSRSALFFLFIISFAFFKQFSGKSLPDRKVQPILTIADFWMVLWTSAVQHHGNSVNGTYLAVFVAFGVITIVSVLGVALQVFTSMVPTSAKTLHENLLEAVLSAPLHFFTSTHTGQTLNRFSQDLSLIDSELPMSLIQVTGPLCLAIIQIVFICLSAAYFAAVLPVVIVVLWALQNYYLRTSKQIRLLDLEAKAPLFSHFLETMQGLVTIRAFGWKDDFARQHTELLDKSQKPFYLMYCIQRWLALVLDLIVAAMAVLLMVLIVKLRERLDAGFVALALLNVMSLNNNLTAIIQMWTGLETSMGAIARLQEFNRKTPSEQSPHESAVIADTWPSGGNVRFSNVCAAYSPGAFDVLHHIDLDISPGERIGICGATGSGKSSLISALFRMLEITKGSITMDGVDISTLPRQVVRSRTNSIPQHALLLKGSVRQNIDPLRLASDLAIETALREVGLWEPLQQPTAGSLDSSVLNLETLLSHGQRQLFCLARAMLRPSSIVVLDEATSSVDVQTDERMQRVIREQFTGRTLIVVAHRLQTIVDFDRVVVMHEGRVVEEGRPAELLQRGDSWFRGLWDA